MISLNLLLLIIFILAALCPIVGYALSRKEDNYLVIKMFTIVSLALISAAIIIWIVAMLVL